MLRSVRVRSLLAAVVFVAGVCAMTALSQAPLKNVGSQSRITGPINEAQVVTLTGNLHPLARGEFDLGAVAEETVLSRMVLELETSPAQQTELDSLVEAQHDTASSLFHKWLTPAEYGARFGADAQDLKQIAAWLNGHGFRVEEIPASNRLVIFSGTADQVAETFHTEIHRFLVNGEEHLANAQDPQIPAALSGLVGGVVSLHDFRRKSQIDAKRPLASNGQVTAAQGGVMLRSSGNGAGSASVSEAQPEYSNGATHYLFPADWATIYDLNLLYNSGKTGSGTSIAIVGRSNINLSDVSGFRSISGLPANNPTVILVGANPGLVSGDQDESTLDVEWSGAIAPGASVKFVVGASTATTDGVDLSAQYIVNHSTAQVMSTSYGSCEQDMGSTELSFYNALWQQAASEGISAFVSSGDSGAAGCDSGSSTAGSVAAVNGLCSSPYSTCVGGTEFNEESNAAQYWSSTNTSAYGSALSYIPEKVWNESALYGGSGLWASTGGMSTVYAQPSWQKGVSGVVGGMRNVPDVAMAAAGHDGYIIDEDGSEWVISGTSAASPSFAGVMALLVQSKGGAGQGNANPGLYSLLNASKKPFHSTPSGNNNVPGVTGFTASGGAYNLATGLGSVDGALLVSNWGSGTATASSPNFVLTQSSAAGAALVGKTVTFTVGVTESGSANSAVMLTAKVPTGITANINPASITSGTSATVTLTVGSSATVGAQSITVTGSNSSGTHAVAYILTVTQTPTLAFTSASSLATLAEGGTEKLNLTASTAGSFAGNITWSITGLPSGVTAAWSANPMTAPSGASSITETLALTASATAKVASSPITITAAGDGLVASKQITLQVTQAPGITLASSPASVSMQSLATAQVTVTAIPIGGFTAASGAAGATIGAASGLPKGLTASWSAPHLSALGVVSWTLTLTGSSAASASSSALSLSARVISTTNASYSATVSLPLTVTLSPPSLSVMAPSTAIALMQGKTTQQVLTLAANPTYSGAVTLSVSGLPSGVTASWSKSPLTLTGASGASTLTLTAASTARVGTATLTITASGDGVTATRLITLQVTQAPGLQLSLAAPTVIMARTGTASITLTVAPIGGLNAMVSLAVAGLPNGVTATFSKPTIAAPGSGTTTLKLTGSSKAAAGTSAVTVKASGVSGGVAYTAAPTLTLQLTSTGTSQVRFPRASTSRR